MTSDHPGLSTAVLSIGPADAQLLVKNIGRQRVISSRTVTRYARDMSEGRWKLSGSSISLWEDTEGKWGTPGEIYVLNGQHRLLAVIESNTIQNFLVVYETDPTVFDTYDTGLVRTVASLIGLDRKTRGLETGNTIAIAGLANTVLRYELFPRTLWNKQQITQGQVVQWVAAQDWLRLTAGIHDYHALRRQTGQLATWYAALAYLVHTHSASPDRWLEFHEPVVHGNDLMSGDARLTFRNMLLRQQLQKGDYWQRQVHTAIGIKAWNAFLTDTPKEAYMFRQNELAKSGMPGIL